MAQFEFKVRTADGELKKGVLTAFDLDQAAGKLSAEGYIITHLKEKRGGFMGLELKARITGKDLSFFYLQLAIQIDCGVTLTESLMTVMEQMDNPALRDVIRDVLKDVESGATFSDALARHKDVFPVMFIYLVQAGESAGVLPRVLRDYADFSDKEGRFRSKIISGAIYPCIMLVASIGIIVFLLTFVFPKFVKVFEKLGGTLPLPTRIIMSSSGFMVNNWLALLVLGTCAIGGAVAFVIMTEEGKRYLDWIKIKAPVMGVLSQQVAMTRFARAMGLLLEGGVGMLEALAIAEKLVGNRLIADEVKGLYRAVADGQSPGDFLEQCSYFPPLMVRMVRTGEKIGALPRLLTRVAGFYERETEIALDGMVSMIEPMMIVSMGVIIGFIALSMFLPLFDLIKFVK